jgi:hypothetical protein
MITNCEHVLNYCSSGSRGKDTIGKTTLKAMSSIASKSFVFVCTELLPVHEMYVLTTPNSKMYHCKFSKK